MYSCSLVRDLKSDVLEAGNLHLDVLQRRVTFASFAVALAPREFTLLTCLMRERGKLMTRSMLFARLYGESLGTSEKAIEVLMSTLRAKLAKVGANELIETRRNMGYIIPS